MDRQANLAGHAAITEDHVTTVIAALNEVALRVRK